MMSESSCTTLRLGTRGSALALAQSTGIARALEAAHGGLRVELVVVKTTGDQITDRPLYDMGGKGLFIKEIEQSLLTGHVDLAVHSYKDVPVTMPLVDPTGLVIAATPLREDPRDVLILRDARRGAIPDDGRVGTSSLRRRCQLLEFAAGVEVVPLRGNIDTRLRQLRAGAFDAIILAAAGLHRAGLYDAASMNPLDLDSMLPAPGQGALAIQCRRDDEATRALIAALNDPLTARCVEAERAVVLALQGDCHWPIAALARISHGTLHLQAAVGRRDGHPPVVRASAAGHSDQVVSAVMRDLTAQGALDLLAGHGDTPER